jgi:hypothetical protein
MGLQKRTTGSRRIAAISACAVFWTLAGCCSEERFRPEYLSGESRLVGGGFKIVWQAPVSGTAYLVERRTGKLVQTVTLGEGEIYKFAVESVVDADDLETLLGIDVDNAQLLLYFKPAGDRSWPARVDEPARK